jgi:hypothetical protein
MTVLEKDRFDSSRYYGRAFDPHYFEGATHSSEKIELKDMSAEEIAAYTRGFNAAEEDGIQKDWG